MSPDSDVTRLQDDNSPCAVGLRPGLALVSAAHVCHERESCARPGSDSSNITASYSIDARFHARAHTAGSGSPDSLDHGYRFPQDPRPHDSLGFTSRPSAALPASHVVSRSGSRSVSSPVDGRQATSAATRAPTGKPRVKDLKKRFDQSGTASSVPRPPTRQGATPHRATRPNARTANGMPAHSNPSVRSQQDSPMHEAAAVARLQRSKHATRGPVAASSSAQSFASRIGRPRNSVNGKLAASRSMTQLSHRVPSQLPSSSPPTTTSRSPGLLFGEIPPDHRSPTIPSFGIQPDRVRTTSESSDRHRATRHRSFSGPHAEPPSPRNWCRQADMLYDALSDARPSRHVRSQSDASASPARAAIACKPLPRISAFSAIERSPSVSRLPVSIRKSGSSTSSTSPSSTRSNSPSTFRYPLTAARISATSPAANSRGAAPIARAKTPTQNVTRRKPPPRCLATPDGHAYLQPYIATPSPKLSPPLRSSRPRLPVSTATTASSRMKATDTTRSRDQPVDGPSRIYDEMARLRKISVGPIDFEQRREHIRLAYSKSIRESEVLEARHVAAEKRRKETDKTANAKEPFETSASAAFLPIAPTIPPSTPVDRSLTRRHPAALEQLSMPSSSGSVEFSHAGLAIGSLSRADVPILTLHTDTRFNQQVTEPLIADLGSPTLGVPGSFPSQSSLDKIEEQALSALSPTSVTTEFDVEPQTSPPIQSASSRVIPLTIVKPPSPQRSASGLDPTEVQQPLEEDGAFPAVPSTDSPVNEITGANDEIRIPGAFGDESTPLLPSSGTYKSQEAVVTILPPQEGHASAVEKSPTAPFPQPNLKMTCEELHCHPEPEHTQQSDRDTGQLGDAATDGSTDQRENITPLRELSSHRSSTCVSSDADGPGDLHECIHDQSQDTTNMSSLPTLHSSTRNDRLSQQFAWTDFSNESNDLPDIARSPAPRRRGDSPTYGHVTIFESRASVQENSLSLRDGSNKPNTRNSSNSDSSPTHACQPQLLEVDTGDGFFVPYPLPTASANVPLPLPDYEPPPVLSSAPGSALNSRTSRVMYDQSYYGSTLVNSEREVDDCTSPLETPQSVNMAISEATEQYFAHRAPADDSTKSPPQESDGKERHRLVQRRNVIKELVDTEAVFVRDMNIVEEIYKGTAEACPELDAKTVKLIFRNSDEIIRFHTGFLRQFKEAVAPIYVPAAGKVAVHREESLASEPSLISNREPKDSRDRATSLGPVFQNNIEKMKLAHEGFLRNSDQAAKRLIQIQQDPTVKVWLNECNEVAKDLTAAWDLNSLLIKPMQRITKYPNLIITLLQHTPHDHPDRQALLTAKESLEIAIVDINKNKKNFELVGQIVGRKRKESDVKAGFARAFGKKVDKLQASNNRPPEDADYVKLNEKFCDDYLRLQVVLRDVEFYTRQVSAYVHEFLQYLSSIELVMRIQPGNYPEVESKWVQFNISVRDLENVALEEHLAQVRKYVIEPFELVIKAYGNPSLAMKKRQKRRIDYERSEQLKRAGRSVDPKLRELAEQYEALNDTLRKELPALSFLTEKVGNICLGNFVNIQASWFAIWKDKIKTVLADHLEAPDLKEVMSRFQREHPFARDQLTAIGILNPASRGRMSQSMSSMDERTLRPRGRGLSMSGDAAPTLPTPDFGERRSGSFAMSPNSCGIVSNPHHYYYRDYYAGIHGHHVATALPRSPETVGGSRSWGGTGIASTRPSTGRSFDSGGMSRQSLELTNPGQRDSGAPLASGHQHPPQDGRRYSSIFHSALPLPDGPDESRRSSRASSRERNRTSGGYKVLWLAASLFEFNIATTKYEAGYPYLTYQAGEIFDVIAEKGELWLAKNQDDPANQVGWIWSKHFAKLADS